MKYVRNIAPFSVTSVCLCDAMEWQENNSPEGRKIKIIYLFMIHTSDNTNVTYYIILGSYNIFWYYQIP